MEKCNFFSKDQARRFLFSFIIFKDSEGNQTSFIQDETFFHHEFCERLRAYEKN